MSRINDLNEMIKKYEYIRDPKKVNDDMTEFSDVLGHIIDITGNPEIVKRMEVPDVLDFLIWTKEYSDKLKTLVVKYGIVLPILKEE